MSIRITDYGLDAVVTVKYPSQLISYTAVGTGSTAPAQSDTALDNEIARTSNDGGFSSSKQTAQDAAGNKLRYEHTSYRVFSFSQAYNLTEYGHFINSNGNSAVFRDLFRQNPNDPNSPPITISVQSGDELQIIRTLILEVPWEEVSTTQVLTVPGGSDLSLPGIQTVGIHAASDIEDLFELVLWPGATSKINVGLLNPGVSVARTQAIDNNILSYTATVRDTYAAGSHQITRRATFPTSQGNAQIAGWALYYKYDYNNSCYKFVIDSGTNFTKSDTHTLELLYNVSWSRG